MREKPVGSSCVSAITHTPASGPFALRTTPPMSLLLIGTVVCACAPGHPKAPVINAPAVKIAAAKEYNLRFFVMKPLPGFAILHRSM
jgi:hypothetical protein